MYQEIVQSLKVKISNKWSNATHEIVGINLNQNFGRIPLRVFLKQMGKEKKF